MANKLIRTVRRTATVKNLLRKGGVTVFRKSIHGRKSTGEIQSNYIIERFYQVFEGTFYNYQLPLKEYESVIRITE